MLNYKPKFIAPDNAQDFENLCSDIYSEIFNCNTPNMYGRKGQKQYGLDILIYENNLNNESNRIGIQCKHVNKLTFDGRSGDSVMKEVRKAEKGKQKISRLIIATSLPSDTKLIDQVNAESENREKVGKFSISIEFIQDIENHINSEPTLIERYILGKSHLPLINQCQKLINEEKYSTSLSILEDNLSDMNKHEQFKASLLLCVCYISLGRKDDFIKILNKLLNFGWHDDNLESLKIQKTLYNQGLNIALKESKELVDKYQHNTIFKEQYLVLRLLNGDNVDYESLDDYCKNSYFVIEQFLWSLLVKDKFNIKEFDKIFDSINSIDKKRPSAKILRLHSYAMDCYKNKTDIKQLEKSLHNFESDLDIEEIESVFYKESAINVLISANARLGNMDIVKALYKKAKTKSIPINSHSINNTIILSLNKNDKGLFDDIFLEFFYKDYGLAFIDGLIHFKDFDKIKEVISEESQLPIPIKNSLFSYMITENNSTNEILQFIQDKNLLEENDLLGLIYLARHFFKHEDEFFQKINDIILKMNIGDEIDNQTLALYLYETKQFDNVVEIYKNNNNYIKNDIHCVNFIRSLMNIDDYHQAKKVIESNLDMVSKNLDFYNIINELCQISADFSLSKKAFEKLENCDGYSWYWCMKIQFSDKKFPIIKIIPEKFLDNTPRNICWLAYQELNNKRTENGKNRILRLWRDNPNNIEILKNLEDIFIESLTNNNFGNTIFGDSYNKVTDGCFVIFSMNDETNYLFIDSKINQGSIDNELYFNGLDNFSSRFLEKQQNDFFEIEDKVGFSEKIKIIEICSILHGVFYQISEKSKKSNSPFKMKAMETDTSPEGIEKFLNSLNNISKKRNEAIIDSLNIYRDNLLPISAFSRYSGVSITNISYNWTDNLGYPLHQINNFNTNDKKIESKDDYNDFVIDTFSLIELQRLNLVSCIDGKNVYIANHAINYLRAESEKKIIGDNILKNIFNKKWVHDYNPKIKDDLDSLLDFLENYVEICPAYGSNINNELYGQIKDFLLDVDLSILRLCKEKDLPLLSFDTRLRLFANYLNIETIDLNEYLKMAISDDDLFYKIQEQQFFDNRSPDCLPLIFYVKNMLNNKNLNQYLFHYLNFATKNLEYNSAIEEIKKLLISQIQLGFNLTEEYQLFIFKLLDTMYQKNNFEQKEIVDEGIDFSILDSCNCFLILHGAKNPILTIKG